MTDQPARTLTPNEHDRAWHAIEHAAGQDDADPGTVLNAVLRALRISAPTIEDEQAASPRRKATVCHPASYAGECPCPPNGRCCKVTPADPTTADDPVRLRWGLNDVLWGDDDTVIVCMTGPGREPYWLELDPEQAAVLRQDLAGPTAEEHQDHPGAELYTQLRKAGLDHDTTNQLIYAHARMAIRQHEALNDATPAVGRQDATQPTTDETEARRRLAAVERLCSGRPGYHQITVKELLTAMSVAAGAES